MRMLEYEKYVSLCILCVPSVPVALIISAKCKVILYVTIYLFLLKKSMYYLIFFLYNFTKGSIFAEVGTKASFYIKWTWIGLQLCL